jgi:hypothetical protein
MSVWNKVYKAVRAQLRNVDDTTEYGRAVLVTRAEVIDLFGRMIKADA